ncbi:MAG: putative enoyl-CoA hydratase/carnitine racemase match [Frankiales bacterium]|nr:putative enoyl-CoA hydratase/carnitine racemase match [Frankiales bacterium]
MERDHVLYEVADGVAEIRLNRPDVRNVLSAGPTGTRAQVIDALAEASDDPRVGAVLLTGAGPAFCAGGDLTGGKPRESALEDVRFLAEADAFHRGLRSAAVPVVAAVQGHCLGAGLLLAASCDLVVASTSASFGLPEGRMGLVGASYLVPVIGRQWAKFLILSGESISATRAQQIGLVLTVVPDDELAARSRDLAVRLARMPREAALLNKRAVDAVADVGGDEAGRSAGLTHDAVTLSMAGRATAPDGRTFRSIIADEGMGGLKQARSAQWTEPWLTDEPAPVGSVD